MKKLLILLFLLSPYFAFAHGDDDENAYLEVKEFVDAVFVQVYSGKSNPADSTERPFEFVDPKGNVYKVPRSELTRALVSSLRVFAEHPEMDACSSCSDANKKITFRGKVVNFIKGIGMFVRSSPTMVKNLAKEAASFVTNLPTHKIRIDGEVAELAAHHGKIPTAFIATVFAATWPLYTAGVEVGETLMNAHFYCGPAQVLYFSAFGYFTSKVSQMSLASIRFYSPLESISFPRRVSAVFKADNQNIGLKRSLKKIFSTNPLNFEPRFQHWKQAALDIDDKNVEANVRRSHLWADAAHPDYRSQGQVAPLSQTLTNLFYTDNPELQRLALFDIFESQKILVSTMSSNIPQFLYKLGKGKMAHYVTLKALLGRFQNLSRALEAIVWFIPQLKDRSQKALLAGWADHAFNFSTSALSNINQSILEPEFMPQAVQNLNDMQALIDYMRSGYNGHVSVDLKNRMEMVRAIQAQRLHTHPKL